MSREGQEHLNRKGAKDAKKEIWNLDLGFGQEEVRVEIEEVAKIIVDSAITVHRALGPGLLESAYQKCLAYELRKRGLRAECEVELPVMYDGQQIDVGYRIDMLVEECVIVENKTVDQLAPIHQAILLTYLRMRDLHLGFLLNWKVLLMKHGIRRVVNNLNQDLKGTKKNI